MSIADRFAQDPDVGKRLLAAVGAAFSKGPNYTQNVMSALDKSRQRRLEDQERTDKAQKKQQERAFMAEVTKLDTSKLDPQTASSELLRLANKFPMVTVQDATNIVKAIQTGKQQMANFQQQQAAEQREETRFAQQQEDRPAKLETEKTAREREGILFEQQQEDRTRQLEGLPEKEARAARSEEAEIAHIEADTDYKKALAEYTRKGKKKHGDEPYPGEKDIDKAWRDAMTVAEKRWQAEQEAAAEMGESMPPNKRNWIMREAATYYQDVYSDWPKPEIAKEENMANMIDYRFSKQEGKIIPAGQ